MKTEPFLTISRAIKTFGGVQALKGVDFEVYPGEVLGLVGENGAGKSTLMRILSGIISPDSGTGEITIDGETMTLSGGPRQAQELGIGMIPQELLLINQLSVEENIFLGQEQTDPFGRIRFSERTTAARRILADIGCDHISPTETVKHLSKANQQLVAIGRRLAQGGRVFIMDEPTAALTEQETESLFRIIRDQLCPKGYAVVFISHRLEEVLSLCDRVIVLRDGERVATMTDVGLELRDELITHMVGSAVSEEYPKGASQIGSDLFSIRDLSYRTNQGAVVQGIDISVRRGEVVGVTGLAGVGKTELGQAIMGLRPVLHGTLTLNDRDLPSLSPIDASRNGIGYVSEDRRGEGLVLNISSLENITLTQPFLFTRFGGFVDHPRERRIADTYAKRMVMKPRFMTMDAGQLSGGNQQKVVIIRQLLRDAEIIIFDEPTKGIDVGAKSEIAHIIGELSAAGKGILLLTSEPREVLGLSDTVYVLTRSGLTRPYLRGEIDYERLMEIELTSDEETKEADDVV